MNIAKAQVPFTILVSTREITTGDELAADCFDRSDNKVARAGDSIDQDLKRRMRNMNVRKAWVKRELPEWMPPAEAQLFDFEVTETHDVSPFHYQVLINFQGSFSTHGIDQLLDLFEQRLDSLSADQQSELKSIRNEFDDLKPAEESLRDRIDDLDNDKLREAYYDLLSTGRPQSVNPSDIQEGEAAIGRRIQSFLESLQRINARVTDVILELSEETIESIVKLDDVDNYEDTSNFLDSFVLFERLYQIPTIEDEEQVTTLFNACADLYEEMFHEQALNQDRVDDITDLLWNRFDPDLPHWIMALGQGGEPRGYLMAHSVNTAILVSQLYRRAEKDPVDDRQSITKACLIMDIGMVLVPQSFHLHRDQMTEEQRKKTRIHPITSKDFYYDISRQSDETNSLILKHHERIDGSGYPRNTTELNRDLRLLTACDMFEAMASPRMWRSAIPPSKVFQTLREEAGTSLDEEWVNHMIRQIGIYPVGTVVRLTNDEPAVVVEHNPDNPAKPTIIPVKSLLKNKGDGGVSLSDSDLSIQSGGTSLKAPVGIRQKLVN